LKVEERDEIAQIGFFKDHQEATHGPILDFKLRSDINSPTDERARQLQNDLSKAGWLFYGFDRRDGELYVQYEANV